MRHLLALLILAQLAGCDGGPGAGNGAGTAARDKAADPRRADLPPAAVTLYAGGAAYIEHRGTVRDDATVELRVKSGQVPGVLKSLVVMDGPTSRPAVAVRPVDPPASAANSSGRLDLAANPTLADLLQQFRGSAVRIGAGHTALYGTIISLEKKGENWQLNLLTKEGIRSVPVDSMQRIELADERAQAELTSALESLWKSSPDDDRRQIAVQLSGKGERPVSIGYAVETRPWKTAYRLMLADKPLLQAWVTVQNDTDADWKNVQLTLASGRPIVLAGDSTLDSTIVSRAAKAAGVPAGESLRRPRPVPARPIDAPPGNVAPPGNLAPPEGEVAPLLDPREVFRQAVGEVSIPRKGTLIVPTFGEPVAVERVAVFNESLLKRNPLQGARIQNTTRHYLLGGTMSVLEDGQYAGDAVLENLAPGRHGVVTWGIEVPLIVDASDDTVSSEIVGGRINEGVAEMQRRHIYTKRYVVENESQKDHVLIVEHAMRRGWTLVEPARPLEATESLYRFRLPAPAGKRVALAVKEEATEIEAVDLATADGEAIYSLSRGGALVADVRSALEKAMAIKQRVAQQDRAAAQAQSDHDRLAAEQARLRENLKSLVETDPLRAKLTEKLEQQEKQLADLRQAIEQGQKECDKARESCEKEIRRISAGK